MSSSFRKVLGRLFGALTTRGRSFLAAGAVAVACGLAIPELNLVRVGALLAILPPASALIARRSRSQLSCLRRLGPLRVPAGQPATVTVRVENLSPRRTEVLMIEDVIPETFGVRRRFTLNEIEPGGNRKLTYQVVPGIRGTFTIGPLRIRAADAFGLAETSRPVSATSTLMVTPRIVPLPRVCGPYGRPGQGDGRWPAFGVASEDDTAARAYQQGDSLHRVHWISTARYGELMVRREERVWRSGASLFLDARRCAHAGSGSSSSFELAVSAAASIDAHLAGAGIRARLITEAGEVVQRGALLDILTAITPSAEVSVQAGASALAGPDGQLIVIAGRLSPRDAAALAASRRPGTPAMALLLAVSAWESGGTCQDAERAAGVLSAAGWRVALIAASTPLAAAWQQLNQAPDPLASAGWLSGVS